MSTPNTRDFLECWDRKTPMPEGLMPTLPYRMTHAVNPPPHPPRPATEEVRFLGDLQRLPLSPGDVLVLSSEANISEDSSARLRQLLEANFPGHKALILGGGLRLGVLGPDVPLESNGPEVRQRQPFVVRKS